MALNSITYGWFFSFLLCVSANSNAGTDRAKQRENQLKLLEEYEAFEAQVNDTITSIFKKLHQEDNCPEDDKGGTGACRKPSPVSLEDFELDLNSLLDRTENVEAVILEFLPVLTTLLLEYEEGVANVSGPIVLSKLSESVDLSCDSKGQPLRLCFWEHRLAGQSRVVNIDGDVSPNGGKTDVDGFAAGKCALKIQPFGINDTGPWLCTLISQNDFKFTGGLILDTDFDDSAGMDSHAIDEHIKEAPDQVQSVSRSNFAFSTTLLEKLPTGKNLVFSPLGLTSSLLIARYGSRGETGTQIERALRLPRPIDLLDLRPNPAFETIQRIRVPARDYSLTMANGLSATRVFRLNTEFTRIFTQQADLSVAQMDFEDGASARNSINSWASSQTNWGADELIPSGSLDRGASLVLASVVHFKSPWDNPFDFYYTEKAPFYFTNGKSTPVDMMALQDDFPYGHLKQLDAHFVSIPYKGDHFSMQVIIPKQIFGLWRIIRALKYTTMDEMLKHVRKPGICEATKIYLPKFKIQSTLDLFNPLGQIGLANIFSPNLANFSGISHDGKARLFVSKFIQKVLFEVDEEGSEASAPAGVKAGGQCTPFVTEVRADRPFYYQIVKQQTNVVILAGVVVDPNA